MAGFQLIYRSPRRRHQTGVSATSSGGGGPGTPDLSGLPNLNKQAPNVAAYTALNVPSQAAGFSYTDPTTGVTVWKITDASTPVTNRSGIPDYFESGPRVSHPWGTGWQYTIDLYFDTATSGGLFNIDKSHYMVDFDLQTGTFSNWRASPAGTDETGQGFALDSANPRYMYKIDGGVLRKWDVSGSSNTEVTTGNWPKDQSANLNGSSKFVWLGLGTDERWFVMMNEGQTRLVAYNVDTDTTIVRTDTDFTGLDEPKFERNGRYAWVRHNTGNSWWDLDTNTIGAFRADATASPQSYKGHSATPRGYAAGVDTAYAGDQWNATPTSAVPTMLNTAQEITWEVNNAGQWVTQSPVDTTQYFVNTGNTNATSFPNEYNNKALAFLRIDGTVRKLLCHHYGAGSDHSTEQYYDGFVWGQPSPDGRLVLFKSSMLSTTGRADAFLAEVPLS